MEKTTKEKKFVYKIGRPPKFTQETFRKKVEEYLTERKAPGCTTPIVLLDFCCFARIHRDYISEHNLKDGTEADFSDTIKLLHGECENYLISRTLDGSANATMAIFALKNNYGWVDRKEIGGANGGAIQQEFIVRLPGSDLPLLEA